MLAKENLSISMYNFQLYVQVEQFNRTVLSRLRLHVAEDDENWDLFSYVLT